MSTESFNPSDSPEVLEMRKYPNRRYYDTTRSKHVTLDQIYKLVQSGKNVSIKDSKTGEDITAKVLTQIILELDSSKLDMFPVSLLTRVIRTHESLVKDFMETYFNQAFSSFLNAQSKLTQSLKKTPTLSEIMSNAPDWQKIMTPPWMPIPVKNSQSEKGTSSPPQWDPRTNPDLSSLQDQLESIRLEIEQLRKKQK